MPKCAIRFQQRDGSRGTTSYENHLDIYGQNNSDASHTLCMPVPEKAPSVICNKLTSQNRESVPDRMIRQILQFQGDRISTQNLTVTQWDALISSSTILTLSKRVLLKLNILSERTCHSHTASWAFSFFLPFSLCKNFY